MLVIFLQKDRKNMKSALKSVCRLRSNTNSLTPLYFLEKSVFLSDWPLQIGVMCFPAGVHWVPPLSCCCCCFCICPCILQGRCSRHLSWPVATQQTNSPPAPLAYGLKSDAVQFCLRWLNLLPGEVEVPPGLLYSGTAEELLKAEGWQWQCSLLSFPW